MNDKMKAIMLIAATVFYVICPIDFIPDFFPGVGQLDDLVAIIIGGWRSKQLWANDESSVA